MKNKKYYTAPEVAEICGCDLKTIHDWFEKGQIKGFRTPGRHLRFTTKNVTTFLSDNNYPPLENGDEEDATAHVAARCFSSGVFDKKKKELCEGDIFEFMIHVQEKSNRKSLIASHGGIESFLRVVQFKFGAFGYAPLHPELVHLDDRKWKPLYSEEEEEVLSSDYILLTGHNLHDDGGCK